MGSSYNYKWCAISAFIITSPGGLRQKENQASGPAFPLDRTFFVLYTYSIKKQYLIKKSRYES